MRGEKGVADSARYMHPYAEEIKSMTYPERMFEIREPQMYLPFDETTAVCVETPEALAEMLEDLKAAEEIAVDLEHHNQRSYVGIVCLMQISTREKDWIVDTLQLRGELQVLNQVFADPNIVKVGAPRFLRACFRFQMVDRGVWQVFHGASADIIWLQRDFGLYVVGLFDTYWGSRVLGFESLGLAFLLKKYADFDADKQYQLADWRLRPLPEEMLSYARSDTHFLLYIFDCLRNELLEMFDPDDPKNKMASVLENSKKVALRVYEKDAYDAVSGAGLLGWQNLLNRAQEALNPMQVAVLKAVHQWRDTIARTEDESVHYIMPKHQLFNLARRMPVDVAGVLACCPRTSSAVRSRVSELVVVVHKAKDVPEVRQWQRSLEEFRAPVAAAPQPMETDDGTATTTAKSEPGAGVDVFAVPLDQARALRAATSTFWGTCDDSSCWKQEQTFSSPFFPSSSFSNSSPSALRLTVPLPQLTAEIFVAEDTTTL